jgi:hypothetical protein
MSVVVTAVAISALQAHESRRYEDHTPSTHSHTVLAAQTGTQRVGANDNSVLHPQHTLTQPEKSAKHTGDLIGAPCVLTLSCVFGCA